MLPFFGTRQDSFPVLARIPVFPDTPPDSINFAVLTPIISFFGTRQDSFPVLSKEKSICYFFYLEKTIYFSFFYLVKSL